MSLKKALLKLKTRKAGANDSEDEYSSTGSGKHNIFSSHSPRVSTEASPRPSGEVSPRSGRSSTDLEGYERGISKKQAKREERRRSKEIRVEEESQSRLRKIEHDRIVEENEPEDIRVRYGDLPLFNSKEADRKHDERSSLTSVRPEAANKEIKFRARVHTLRRMGPKLVFIVFRQQTVTVQGVMHEEEGIVSKHMVQWAEHLNTGTIVICQGVIQTPDRPIKGATCHDAEVKIHELHVVSRRVDQIAFSVYDDEITAENVEAAQKGEVEEDDRMAAISDRTRLANRIIDLRTTPSQSIFRIQAGICNLFRGYLDDRGFLEIHTPKLQPAATESGSSVFKVEYFGRPAFLAQSPQLAKQMAISADFEKVYEIGPVFRAENSNTHRHMTEFVGLDLEMAFEEHYHEALELIDGMFKSLFQGIYARYRKEIDLIKHRFPHEDLLWLDHTPVFAFADAIQMLNDSGYTKEDGTQPAIDEDMGTRDEIALGKVIREKYKTDFYIIDKFPVTARPFYAMRDPVNSRVTNSFDVFLRGQEITTGGQRVHDPQLLEQQMGEVGIDPDEMADYMDAFRWAAPPHAGCGIGLERLLFLLLNLGNIRHGSMFPRDPKSFPAKPPPPELRYPDDSTLHPPWTKIGYKGEKQLQPLGNLIANYGDATNTSWFDDRFNVWRDPSTGAAISWVPVHGHAILPGDPLCAVSQYPRVINNFLKWLKKETKYKPIWVLAGSDLEEVLGENFGWKTFSCAAEERVNPEKDRAQSDKELARKVRHAEREGVRIQDYDSEVPDNVRKEVDDRIQDWLSQRQGKQVHLSEITPWRDHEHRKYFIARDGEKKVCALVVLATLAVKHGYQAKWCLDFPGAPNGTIEAIVLHSIRWAALNDVKSMTFGSGPTERLVAGHHMTGAKVKLLEHTYQAIVKQLKLINKTEFRAKLGASEDPVYICYPRHGLGTTGMKAVMDFFED